MVALSITSILLSGCTTSVAFALMLFIFLKAPKDKPIDSIRLCKGCLKISFTEEDDE